jgi:hypothetical protein
MLQVIRSIFWILLFPSATNEDSAVLLGGLVSLKESKKEDSTNSTIKNSGLEKQNQGGKNYDLRDAIKQIEGIKLIQQEQQKKYFLTIPSLLKVPPNLHSLQM